MTTIQSTARLVAALRGLPWGAIAARTGRGLRACWLAAQLLAAAVAIGCAIAWEHRAQIRAALVATIAAAWVAAEATWHAGRWSRRQLLALADRSAVLLPQQPLAVVAPITATIEAAREALARLIARLYPVVAA